MRRTFKNIRFLLILSLILLTNILHAQVRNYGMKDWSCLLPAEAICDTLPNGFSYIILKNNSHIHKVEMRLVLQVGSIQEEDDEKGVAHFLEHTAFLGTKHFPGRDILDYWEKHGMKYGRDINALTGYDRTIYMLSIPVERTSDPIIDTTLLAMRDWIDGISFDSHKIEKEKKVILEELRSYHQPDPFYKLKIGTGKHADRIPLGEKKDLLAIDKDKISKFHDRWYAPNRAVLVIVGNINESDVRKSIVKYFGSLRRKTGSQFKANRLCYNKGVRLMQNTDTIKRNSILELIVPHEDIPLSDKKTLQTEFSQQLLLSLLSDRIRQYKMPIQVSDQWYLADKKHFVFSVTATGKKVLLHHVTDAMALLKSFSEKNISVEELHRFQKQLVSQISLTDKEILSPVYCEDFIDCIITGSGTIYNQDYSKNCKQIIAKILPEDIKRCAKQLLAELSKNLLVTYQNNSGLSQSISVADVQKSLEKGRKKILSPLTSKQEDTSSHLSVSIPKSLMKMPVYDKNQVIDSTYYTSLGLTEFKMCNGLIVLLKPIKDASKRIHIHLLGRGGFAGLSDKQYYQLENTAEYIDMGGVKSLSADSLLEIMSANKMAMNIGINKHWHELVAMAPTDKAQVLFNLIEEKIVNPELRYQDFEQAKNDEMDKIGKTNILASLMQRDANFQVQKLVDSIMMDRHKWEPQREKNIQDIKEMSLDSIADFYKRLFTQAKESTLLISGDIDVNTIKPLAFAFAEKLTGSHNSPNYLAHPYDLDNRRMCHWFYHDHSTLTDFQLLFTGNYHPSLHSTLLLKIMRDVLQNRMISRLREGESMVYSPAVSLIYNGVPQQTYCINIMAAVKNQNFRRVQNILQEIINELRQSPIKDKELQNIKQSFLVNKKQVLHSSAGDAWRQTLSQLVKNGESLSDFDHYEECLKSITVQDVNQAFKQYVRIPHSKLLYLSQKPQ